MRRVINMRPGRVGAAYLGALPFVALACVYLIGSDMRLAENPNDKLLPAVSSFADAIERLAFAADRRSGDYILWTDTFASLKRLATGLAIAASLGLGFGLATGVIPYACAALAPLIGAISMVPPMAILPILFIALGLGELAKVALIVIGVTPFLIRDLGMHVAALPRELLVKAQTLGGSSWQIILRVVLPMTLPRLIQGVRLSLGPAWLFLIASEAIASTDGLGYRIFLMRRYLAMDVILPYVVWITMLAFLIDQALDRASRWAFPWHRPRPAEAAS